MPSTLAPIISQIVSWGIVVGILAVSVPSIGAIEIGAAGNYRRVNLDSQSFDESSSITATLGWYLSESAAVELSYTDGNSTRYYGSVSSLAQTAWTYFRMAGLDLVYTVGDRETIFRPYFKVGAAYILEKRLVTQYDGMAANQTSDPPALVPSAGIGMRISLNPVFALKFGVEGWLSDDQNNDIDYAGLAGVSWTFY